LASRAAAGEATSDWNVPLVARSARGRILCLAGYAVGDILLGEAARNDTLSVDALLLSRTTYAAPIGSGNVVLRATKAIQAVCGELEVRMACSAQEGIRVATEDAAVDLGIPTLAGGINAVPQVRLLQALIADAGGSCGVRHSFALGVAQLALRRIVWNTGDTVRNKRVRELAEWVDASFVGAHLQVEWAATRVPMVVEAIPLLA